jgi:hypothetical protein
MQRCLPCLGGCVGCPRAIFTSGGRGALVELNFFAPPRCPLFYPRSDGYGYGVLAHRGGSMGKDVSSKFPVLMTWISQQPAQSFCDVFLANNPDAKKLYKSRS